MLGVQGYCNRSSLISFWFNEAKRAPVCQFRQEHFTSEKVLEKRASSSDLQCRSLKEFTVKKFFLITDLSPSF